ncbi:unnamed protein product [Caenorhabditis auriculariae]|uniref:Enoyl reductase (ER) domain-containing protein n=1 Tax=Caenorhabditis auriculariae TaxID=2777116 RepID=A0A8S1GNX6_9PELO|nr:unnamed protein product [Caenorhabditis auriculariae]
MAGSTRGAPQLLLEEFYKSVHAEGAILRVGSSIKNVKVGERVWYGFSSGSSAEFSIVQHAFPLPDEVSFTDGATLGVPFLTAYRALFVRGRAQKGDLVLVHGASGGVGSAAVQLAVSRGLQVVGTAGTDDGLDFVRTLGASDVFNHRKAGYVEEIKKKYPQGFNMILEMAAHVNLNVDLGLLAPNGEVAVIGNRGDVNVNARQLMAVEGQIFGVALNRTTPEEFEEMGAGITEFLKKSSFRSTVQKEYTLEEISQAHVDIMKNDDAVSRPSTPLAPFVVVSDGSGGRGRCVDVNIGMEGGLTALHAASLRNYEDLVRFLLRKGALVNSKDLKGYSPFLLACVGGQLEVAEILLKNGADINTQNSDGNRPLNTICNHQIYEKVWPWLLERGAQVNYTNKLGTSPAHIAIECGSSKMLDAYLERGAPINAWCRSRRATPLILAIRNRGFKFIDYLICHGVDQSIPDEEGNTPLQLANKVLGELVDQRHQFSQMWRFNPLLSRNFDAHTTGRPASE